MAKDRLVSDRNLADSGLYSLKGGQASQVPGPTPGINTPGPSMMMRASAPVQQQQQSSSANLYNILALLKGLFGKNTAGGQAGIQPRAQPQTQTTLPRGYSM